MNGAARERRWHQGNPQAAGVSSYFPREWPGRRLCAQHGNPLSGLAVVSSNAALSRTERVRACFSTSPFIRSPKSAPSGFRAPWASIQRPRSRRPECEGSLRRRCRAPWAPCPRPPPPRPPLEPPRVRLNSQGLRQGPKNNGSVVGKIPNSGVFVFPTITKPARLRRTTNSLS